jgi:hypothetical protein
MKRLVDAHRDYRRFRHSAVENLYLNQNGFISVESSNVSAVAKNDEDLIIRFHNGSIYRYYGQGNRYDDIFKSNSKGKWVWRNLRRKAVRYAKIGTLPLPDDLGITDEDIFNELEERYVKDLNKVLQRDVGIKVIQSKLGVLREITIGGIVIYQPM